MLHFVCTRTANTTYTTLGSGSSIQYYSSTTHRKWYVYVNGCLVKYGDGPEPSLRSQRMHTYTRYTCHVKRNLLHQIELSAECWVSCDLETRPCHWNWSFTTVALSRYKFNWNGLKHWYTLCRMEWPSGRLASMAAEFKRISGHDLTGYGLITRDTEKGCVSYKSSSSSNANSASAVCQCHKRLLNSLHYYV